MNIKSTPSSCGLRHDGPVTSSAELEAIAHIWRCKALGKLLRPQVDTELRFFWGLQCAVKLAPFLNGVSAEPKRRDSSCALEFSASISISQANATHRLEFCHVYLRQRIQTLRVHSSALASRDTSLPNSAAVSAPEFGRARGSRARGQGHSRSRTRTEHQESPLRHLPSRKQQSRSLCDRCMISRLRGKPAPEGNRDKLSNHSAEIGRSTLSESGNPGTSSADASAAIARLAQTSVHAVRNEFLQQILCFEPCLRRKARLFEWCFAQLLCFEPRQGGKTV